MYPTQKTPQPDSPAVQRLDSVRMSEAKRSLAKQHMRQAEAAVDAIVALGHWVQAAVGRWSQRLRPDDRQREAYLSRAVDHVDLEHRIRALERRHTWRTFEP